MSHYRKIDVRIWNDEKFISLGNIEKLAFLFFLTHPNLTSLGAMRATIAGLSSELGVPEKEYAKPLEIGLMEADRKACLVSAPNFIKYNPPENPNVVISWGRAYDMLPECDLKRGIYVKVKQVVKGYSKGFGKAFDKAFVKEKPKTYPKQ